MSTMFFIYIFTKANIVHYNVQPQNNQQGIRINELISYILHHTLSIQLATNTFVCMVTLPWQFLSCRGLAFTVSTVTTSGHYCLKTTHGVSHSGLSYASASYSRLATPEGMLITFSLALN